MKYYFVGELDVTQREWVRDYVRETTRMVEIHGGRYLARTPHIERIEGTQRLRSIFLLIEWPSREAALAFYRSAAYQPYLQSRLTGADTELLLVAGEDINGVARTTSNADSTAQITDHDHRNTE